MSLYATIVEMGRAWFRYGTHAGANETCLDAKPGTHDPTKHRQGTSDPGNYFGAFSGDFLGPEDVRYEKVLVGLKPDDDAPQVYSTQPGGSFEVSCQRPGTTDDRDMVRGLRVTSRYIELFGRRLIEVLEGEPRWLIGGGQPDRMLSGNGRWMTVQQGDGNFVTYDLSRGAPRPETAVWSAWTGRIR